MTYRGADYCAGTGTEHASTQRPFLSSRQWLSAASDQSKASDQNERTEHQGHGQAGLSLRFVWKIKHQHPPSDARKRREKVAGKTVILDRALGDTLPYLYALLGIVEGDDPLAAMDAQLRKRRTLDAVKRLVLRESLNLSLIHI